MTLIQLKYILTIAETKSLNKAAEQLYVSQPSLTNALKELEKEIVKMKDNDSMRIITKTYMWLSGSGNHTGYTTEVTYKII